MYFSSWSLFRLPWPWSLGSGCAIAGWGSSYFEERERREDVLEAFLHDHLSILIQKWNGLHWETPGNEFDPAQCYVVSQEHHRFLCPRLVLTPRTNLTRCSSLMAARSTMARREVLEMAATCESWFSIQGFKKWKISISPAVLFLFSRRMKMASADNFKSLKFESMNFSTEFRSFSNLWLAHKSSRVQQSPWSSSPESTMVERYSWILKTSLSRHIRRALSSSSRICCSSKWEFGNDLH